MSESLFLWMSGLFFFSLVALGWRLLPGDRFQILASMPVHQAADGSWRGQNLTWYGAITATAALFGISYAAILAVAAGSMLPPMACALSLIAGIGLPASKIMARLVEKKRHTFTIGGAFFCGLVMTPFILLAVDRACLLLQVPGLPVAMALAAIAIGYVLGEGLGRLACISFGCCYGKPLAQCHRVIAGLMRPVAFVFAAPTKKAVYEGGFAGEPLLPIQGITSVVLTVTALFSTHLFLNGWYRPAFLCCLVVSQGWRFFSEILRADFRGFSTVTAYQKMAFAAVLYGCILCLILPPSPQGPMDIGRGLRLFTGPLVIVGLQLLWLLVFFVFGRSTVTGARLWLHVRASRI